MTPRSFQNGCCIECVFWCIGLALPISSAQEVLNPDVKRERVLEVARDIVKNARRSALITIDRSGARPARTMDPQNHRSFVRRGIRRGKICSACHSEKTDEFSAHINSAIKRMAFGESQRGSKREVMRRASENRCIDGMTAPCWYRGMTKLSDPGRQQEP